MRDIVLPPTYSLLTPGHWDFRLAGVPTDLSRRLDCRHPLHVPNVTVPKPEDLLPIPESRRTPPNIPVWIPTDKAAPKPRHLEGGIDSADSSDGMSCKILTSGGYFGTDNYRAPAPRASKDAVHARTCGDVYYDTPRPKRPDSHAEAESYAPPPPPTPARPRYSTDVRVALGFFGLSALHVAAKRLAETRRITYSVERAGGDWLNPVYNLSIKGDDEAEVRQAVQALQTLYAEEVVS